MSNIETTENCPHSKQLRVECALELLPCPFCGAMPYIKSNRDTHKLQADHKADCFFDGEEVCEVPATDDHKAWMVSVWNTRL